MAVSPYYCLRPSHTRLATNHLRLKKNLSGHKWLLNLYSVITDPRSPFFILVARQLVADIVPKASLWPNWLQMVASLLWPGYNWITDLSRDAFAQSLYSDSFCQGACVKISPSVSFYYLLQVAVRARQYGQVKPGEETWWEFSDGTIEAALIADRSLIMHRGLDCVGSCNRKLMHS